MNTTAPTHTSTVHTSTVHTPAGLVTLEPLALDHDTVPHAGSRTFSPGLGSTWSTTNLITGRGV